MSNRRSKINVTVNERPFEAEIEPRLLLVDFIREVVGLRGTHVGCDTTHCGACTVLLDGRSAKSCTVLAVQADGRKIVTVEGPARDGNLHVLQEAFWDHHALQCGYCTPGMVMSAFYFLSTRRDPHPTEAEIREAIAGNLCRCTGYQFIVDAVKSTAKRLHAGAESTRKEDR